VGGGNALKRRTTAVNIDSLSFAVSFGLPEQPELRSDAAFQKPVCIPRRLKLEFSAYFVILRRWWWSLVLSTITAALCGYLIAGTIPRFYESGIRLLVGPINANVEVLRGSSLLIPTYAELVTSDEVLEEAAARLDLDASAAALRSGVDASANNITRVLTISVTDTEPESAALLAQTLADSLVTITERGGSGTLDGTALEGTLTVIEPASFNPTPIAPDVSLLVVLASLAGMVGGIVIVLLLEYVSDTVKDGSELASEGAVYMGSVNMPAVSRRSTQPLMVDAYPESRAATTIRLLATKVTYSFRNEPLRSLLVIGTEHGGGSGELAANFAAVLARSGKRVSLVDANDDVPEITRMLSNTERPGVGELLEAPIAPERAKDILELTVLRRPPGMDFVPRGSTSSRLVDLDRAHHFIELLNARSDFVVVNGAAVHRSASTLVWAQAADAVLVVVHRDRTKRENLEHTIKSLRVVGARLAGVTLVERRGIWLGWGLGAGSMRTGTASGNPSDPSRQRRMQHLGRMALGLSVRAAAIARRAERVRQSPRSQRDRVDPESTADR
jgi:succinoglycan biosynthesis transport protein ExoP